MSNLWQKILHKQVFVCKLKGLLLFLLIFQHEPIYSTQQGYDLHCAAPFKNVSSYHGAWYKSEVVD